MTDVLNPEPGLNLHEQKLPVKGTMAMLWQYLMPSVENVTPLLPSLALVLLLAAALLWGGLAAARERPNHRMPKLFKMGIALSLVAMLFAVTLLWFTRHFDSVSLEQPIAIVRVVPAGPRQFKASIEYQDGRVENFLIRGDELYIDAHLLKWKSWAQWFGLRNLYKLDRIGGRYATLEDEKNQPRTLFALEQGLGPDLYQLRKRWDWLSPLVDAQYGSAAFVPVGSGTTFALALGPSGLIIRPLDVDQNL